MAAKKKAAAKEKPNTLGTKEVSAKLGISPTTFRRVLRAAGKNSAGEYSRYEWKPEDVQGEKLEKLKKLVADHTQPKEKGKKKTTGKKKATTTGRASKKKTPPEDTEELEDSEEMEEELV